MAACDAATSLGGRLCKDCRRQFTRNYTNLGCIGAVRDLVVPLTING
jgi:hypothetical protein